MFEIPKVRTNVKYRCVSVLGVKLWNGLNDELKMCFSCHFLGRILKFVLYKVIEISFFLLLFD